MVDAWDPDQYNRYAREREQPFWDLVALLEPVGGATVVDLGCGDGRLTAALHGALGASATLGIDSSEAMHTASEAHASPSVTFELGDVGPWTRAGGFDVVFSNAALHWLPDHAAVLGRWIESLRPGGQLAVQMPSNADQVTHRVAAELGAELLAEPPPDPVAENVCAPERYASLLYDLGCVEQRVRLEVYAHVLASTSDVVEWLKGTMLTRFKEPLGPEGWNDFVARYRERLVAILGDRSPYLFPFKRILLWGRLP